MHTNPDIGKLQKDIDKLNEQYVVLADKPENQPAYLFSGLAFIPLTLVSSQHAGYQLDVGSTIYVDVCTIAMIAKSCCSKSSNAVLYLNNGVILEVEQTRSEVLEACEKLKPANNQ